MSWGGRWIDSAFAGPSGLVDVVVVVDVDVVAPVIVDVHLNGTGPVVVVGSTVGAPPLTPRRVDHVHGSVLVQVHVDDHGGDHDHDYDYDHGQVLVTSVPRRA